VPMEQGVALLSGHRGARQPMANPLGLQNSCRGHGGLGGAGGGGEDSDVNLVTVFCSGLFLIVTLLLGS
jgi:hypothetical protein